MSTQNVNNTQAFIEAQQYSAFILENLKDGLMPEGFYRDVSDFGTGTTLNIKTVGTVTIQDASEDVPLIFNPIDTGTITMSITDYIGDAWAVQDMLREDASQVEQLMAMRAMESTRAIQEQHETRFLSVCNSAQTDGNANLVNGFAHRLASAETGNKAALSHFVKMKLAFDKANVPQQGRIAIVDPVVEATLNSLATATISMDRQPFFQNILEEGWAKEHKFVANIMGWDIYTSNRLATGTLGDGTTSVTGAVANIFMSVLDDSTKPIMHAWRRMPKTEGWRDYDNRQDKFQVTSRYGFGAQRVDTLGILVTSASNY